MKRKTKADYEREFVQHIASVGIKGWCEMDEGRKTYYRFWLKDGTERYWTNLLDESRDALWLNEGQAVAACEDGYKVVPRVHIRKSRNPIYPRTA